MRFIIIPTLNEAENIEMLVREIYDACKDDEVQIVIVDDDSTDETHEIVRKMQDEFPTLSMIIRQGGKGLSSAVRTGAELIGNNPVVVMDADLSHNPKYIPMIFDKLSDGYDLVGGSRYVPQGKIIGWPGSRIAIRC